MPPEAVVNRIVFDTFQHSHRPLPTPARELISYYQAFAGRRPVAVFRAVSDTQVARAGLQGEVSGVRRSSQGASTVSDGTPLAQSRLHAGDERARQPPRAVAARPVLEATLGPDHSGWMGRPIPVRSGDRSPSCRERRQCRRAVPGTTEIDTELPAENPPRTLYTLISSLLRGGDRSPFGPAHGSHVDPSYPACRCRLPATGGGTPGRCRLRFGTRVLPRRGIVPRNSPEVR